MEEKMRILEDLNMIYIRQIALSLQDSDIQKKIDHEIRMRDGTCKLLAACSQKDQALEAAKSLLTCNARILAYMSELQRMKEAQVMQRAERRPSDASALDNRIPCQGKVAISDLRIPLMWKDTEYFKNKGELHRCAVFCVLQLGGQIFDTDMVMVDRTLTDICFENTVVFNEVSPGFELRVELYSCCTEEEFSGGNAPKKLSSMLSSSLGRSSGKKVRAALETGPCSPVCNGGGSPILLPSPTVPGPKYHLLAHTTLTLAHVRDSFRTHDLSICGSEECSYWLPLYGRVCCRLAARPDCMTQEVMSGSLKVKLGEDPQCWTNIHGVLRGTNLMCFHQLEDTESGVEPVFTIAINKETRIRATEKEPLSKVQSISICNHYGGEEVTHTLATDSREDTQHWMEAFWQQFYDMSQWKQCCDSLMKIEVPSPRKPTIVTAKQGSLYHEMVIEAADDPDVLKDIWKKQMQDFESCSQPGTYPQCTSVFEETRGYRAAVHSPRPRCRTPRSPDPGPRSAPDSTKPSSYPCGLETPLCFRHRALSADTKPGSLLASRHGAPQCRHQARPPSSTQTPQHGLSSTSTSSSAEGSTTSDTDSAPYSCLAKPPRPRGPASQTGPVPMATNACVTPSPKHAPKGMFTPLSPHRTQSQDLCSRVAEPRKSYQHVRQ